MGASALTVPGVTAFEEVVCGVAELNRDINWPDFKLRIAGDCLVSEPILIGVFGDRHVLVIDVADHGGPGMARFSPV